MARLTGEGNLSREEQAANQEYLTAQKRDRLARLGKLGSSIDKEKKKKKKKKGRWNLHADPPT